MSQNDTITSDAANPKLSVIIVTYNNAAILERCLASWEKFAADQPVEIIVIADGCHDRTSEILEARSATRWGKKHLRWFREDNVHELRCTNRGMAESKGELILSWHDDMFLASYFLTPELIAFFDQNEDLGLMGLCRGLQCHADTMPMTWDELTWPDRLESTIGPKLINWFAAYEVDAIMRPWITRRACIDRVGMLDTAFKLSEWDEADLCFRISEAGWKIATHAYERLGAYTHLGSSTISRTTTDAYKQQVLANGKLFYSRWAARIRERRGRPRKTWRRPSSAASMAFTLSSFTADIRRRLARGKRLEARG